MSETCCSVDSHVHVCGLGCFWKAQQLLGIILSYRVLTILVTPLK